MGGADMGGGQRKLGGRKKPTRGDQGCDRETHYIPDTVRNFQISIKLNKLSN